MLPFFSNNFYYITVALQVICVIHCIRRGTKMQWIWLIVFVPVVGSIAYIFIEMFSGREIRQVQSGIGSLINPAGSIRKLEENLRFSDTFNNRMALGNAYLGSGQTDKAVELYESCYTGAFMENEDLLKQLIVAYSMQQRYKDVLPMAQKLYKTPQFARSQAHLLYAIALEHTGNPAQAEKEFKIMNVRYSHFEPRYQYGLFLQRAGRHQEARDVFAGMVDESSHLSARERSHNRVWFAKAKEELRQLR